jgi:hypothetical protein
MTPEQEKAQQLVEMYNELAKDFTRGVSMKEFSKQCAIIAIDQVLKYSKAHGFIALTQEYEQIKQEIENL